MSCVAGFHLVQTSLLGLVALVDSAVGSLALVDLAVGSLALVDLAVDSLGLVDFAVVVHAVAPDCLKKSGVVLDAQQRHCESYHLKQPNLAHCL